MKKLILTVAIALSVLTITGCKKEKIEQINHSILNDKFEGNWTIYKTSYYDTTGIIIWSNIGSLKITDRTFKINNNFYIQNEIYNVHNISNDSIVYMNINNYGLESLGNKYSMKFGNNENELILTIPNELDSTNFSYKIIKASR